MTDSLLGNKTHTRKWTHTQKQIDGIKQEQSRREDGGSDRQEVKQRYMGGGQNEEEGNPSSRGSPWTHPVIGWYPKEKLDVNMAAFAS